MNQKRVVKLFISGHTNFHKLEKPTYYQAILVDVSTNKETLLTDMDNEEVQSTPNRAIINGIITGLLYLMYKENKVVD